MLTDKEYKQIRKELDECQRPLFFFHDDPDGLCSFLLLYRYKREGKGIPVKSTPKVDSRFLRKVEEYNPDKIFVVDLALLEDEFIEGVKVPIIYIDHHGPLEINNSRVKYFNPRLKDKDCNLPAAYMCYRVVNQDMWIAAVGCVGDWFFPPFAKDFRKEYKDLLPSGIKRPEDALFNSRLGELVKIVSFILKGKLSEVMKCIKIMTRVESPYEILDQTTARGKLVYKRAHSMVKEYERLWEQATTGVDSSKLLVFIYHNAKFSFTKELANELLYKYPKKKLIICREQNGEMKCSLRSTDVILPPMVEKALIGVEGYGGGHEHACGTCVKKEDFSKFVEQFKEQL